MGQARDLMDRSTEAWLAKDYDASRALCSPDIEVVTPDAGPLRGIDQFLDWQRQLNEAFPDVRYESTLKLEDGNRAIDVGDVIGTHSGPLAMPDGSSIPATGKQVRMRSCDIATVEGGVITKHEFFYDQMDMAMQLGIVQQLAAIV